MTSYDAELIKILPTIKGYIFKRMIKEGTEWEDICSETTLATIKFLRAGRMNEKFPLCPIVLCIARTKISDYYRVKKRRGDKLSQAERALQAWGEIEHKSSMLLTDELSYSLRFLTRKQYIAMLYLAFESQNQAEIARLLGVSREAIRCRVFRARQALNAMEISA